MGRLNRSTLHPQTRRRRYSSFLTFFRRQLRLLTNRKSDFRHPCNRIQDRDFFDYEGDVASGSSNMFHETKRGWEARVVREKTDVQRSVAYKADRKTRRRHSTLAEHTDHFGVPEVEAGRQRYLRDRKERKKERRYTSSAFDTTKAVVQTPQNQSSSLFGPNFPQSSSGSAYLPPPAKNYLSVDITDPSLTQPKRREILESIHRPKRPIHNDQLRKGHGISYSANRTLHAKHRANANQSRDMFRVTSNIEESSFRTQRNAASKSYNNRIPFDVPALNKRPLDKNSVIPIPGPEKRLHSELACPRHADREKTSRDMGLRARISPRSPNQPHYTGRPTRNFASASTKLNASQRLPTGINVVKTLSYDDTNDRGSKNSLREQGRRSQDSCSSSARSSGRLRQDSNFSRLSAQSWMSIESEENLTEKEAKLLTSNTSGYCRKASGPSGKSSTHHMDHIPGTLFDVDPDGNALERISNEDPYCLSVMECCTIIQIGADISKKLVFNRYEQRRVWMSSDFLRLCWTSKKAGVNEDNIRLSQVAKIKLADRTLSIEMIGGYGICFMFPSVTSAGLWVRALACLVPLQAQIKIPLGVTIATEREREEFSLAEDKFGERPIREYMAVNNYVALCNPISTPRDMGLKMAFSFTEDRFFGFRYVPRQAIHHMLRTKKEIAILKRLNHPNLVKHYEILEDPNHRGMYVVFEHLSRGCIADSNNLQRMQLYKEAHVRMILKDIVDALLYLHSVRITHADVRPENILMAPNGCVKLNPIGCIMHDFNNIESRTAHIRCRLGSASTAFLAPEQCWLSKAPQAGRESPAMDVWGVGALMFTLLCGRTPFHGSNNQELQENICWTTMQFPMDTPISKEAKSLMFQILTNKDPRTRMSMSEVRDHPWFNDQSIPSPNSSARHSFSDFHEFSGDRSPLLAISQDEINSAVHPAKVRITARKKKGTPRPNHRQV